MIVTRDVVRDLLPVYLAGEASADTRALVEEWLRTDEGLAQEAEESGRIELPPVPPPAPTIEKQALDQTRRVLRWRSILLGAAIYFSLLPLSVVFSSRGYRGFLIDNWPERVVVIALAIVLWILYWRMARRTRAAGV